MPIETKECTGSKKMSFVETKPLAPRNVIDESYNHQLNTVIRHNKTIRWLRNWSAGLADNQLFFGGRGLDVGDRTRLTDLLLETFTLSRVDNTNIDLDFVGDSFVGAPYNVIFAFEVLKHWVLRSVAPWWPLQTVAPEVQVFLESRIIQRTLPGAGLFIEPLAYLCQGRCVGAPHLLLSQAHVLPKWLDVLTDRRVQEESEGQKLQITNKRRK